jgi:hypothetical protein
VLALASCTLLANGRITRTAEVSVRPGSRTARLVIEDLEKTVRQAWGSQLRRIRTPLEGRASQIDLVSEDAQVCFAIDDYIALNQMTMLQGNPYKRMDFKLERSDGVMTTEFQRGKLSDERFDVEYVIRGDETNGFVDQELSATVLHVTANVCFPTPQPFAPTAASWIRLRAGVSRYTFKFG